jgi:hypothetical protein
MQEAQFEGLFKGVDGVKFFPEMQNPKEFQSLSDLMRGKKIEEANQVIEKNAIEMPQKLTSAVRLFIDQARKLKIKERTIRRMVKKKFGIMIVPNI